MQINSTFKGPGFKRYFKNTSWLFTVHGLRLLAGFFIGLWMARYLGPEQFGIYNYVYALNYFFLAIASMGVTDTLVKKIVEHPDDVTDYLSAGFWIRLIAGLATLILQAVFVFMFPQGETVTFLLFLVSPILLFQAFDVVDLFYSAKVSAHESAKWRILQILISSLLRIYFLITDASLLIFVVMGLFDTIFYAAMIYVSYTRGNPGFIRHSLPYKKAQELIKDSFPLMLVAFGSIVFSRIDQVLIGRFIDQKSVGIYSSAARIIELSTFFYIFVIQSVFPAIVSANNSRRELYLDRLRWLSRLILVTGLVGACLLAFNANLIIRLLYGASYEEAASLLPILSLNALLVGMSMLSHRWYLVENLQVLMTWKICLLALTNFLANLWVIPRYGIEGAAYCSLASNFIFFFLFEAFFRKTRPLFWINCQVSR